MPKLFFLAVLAAFVSCVFHDAHAAGCRKVADEQFIQINSASLELFKKAGLSRETIFELLKSIAEVETSGC